MKKVIIMLMLLAPLATFAQKFGHVNTEAIVQSLPDYSRAKGEIEAIGKQYENELQASQTELQRQAEDYDKKKRKGDIGRQTVAFTCNADGSDVRRSFPDGWDGSHFNWKDGSTICVTAKFDAKKWSHVEYTVGDEAGAHMLGGGRLDWDGHCTYSPDGKWLSTEGYRDAKHNRHWKMLRLSDGAVFDLGAYFVPAAYRPGYWRCDLHARWRSDSRQLAFNSTHEGTRQIYLIDIK